MVGSFKSNSTILHLQTAQFDRQSFFTFQQISQPAANSRISVDRRLSIQGSGFSDLLFVDMNQQTPKILIGIPAAYATAKSTGTSVSAMIMAPSTANVFVYASGWNSLPS